MAITRNRIGSPASMYISLSRYFQYQSFSSSSKNEGSGNCSLLIKTSSVNSRETSRPDGSLCRTLPTRTSSTNGLKNTRLHSTRTWTPPSPGNKYGSPTDDKCRTQTHSPWSFSTRLTYLFEQCEMDGRYDIRDDALCRQAQNVPDVDFDEHAPQRPVGLRNPPRSHGHRGVITHSVIPLGDKPGSSRS